MKLQKLLAIAMSISVVLVSQGRSEAQEPPNPVQILISPFSKYFLVELDDTSFQWVADQTPAYWENILKAACDGAAWLPPEFKGAHVLVDEDMEEKKIQFHEDFGSLCNAFYFYSTYFMSQTYIKLYVDEVAPINLVVPAAEGKEFPPGAESDHVSHDSNNDEVIEDTASEFAGNMYWYVFDYPHFASEERDLVMLFRCDNIWKVRASCE